MLHIYWPVIWVNHSMYYFIYLFYNGRGNIYLYVNALFLICIIRQVSKKMAGFVRQRWLLKDDLDLGMSKKFGITGILGSFYLHSLYILCYSRRLHLLLFSIKCYSCCLMAVAQGSYDFIL